MESFKTTENKQKAPFVARTVPENINKVRLLSINCDESWRWLVLLLRKINCIQTNTNSSSSAVVQTTAAIGRWKSKQRRRKTKDFIAGKSVSLKIPGFTIFWLKFSSIFYFIFISLWLRLSFTSRFVISWWLTVKISGGSVSNYSSIHYWETWRTKRFDMRPKRKAESSLKPSS